MDAETPGPGIQKLTPHIAETARALWIAYIAFTVLEFALLYGLHLVGLAPNMTLFNAVAHPLTTLPTGRFSPEARSIEAFAPIVQWIVIPLMIVAGTNFALVWQALRGDRSVLSAEGVLRSDTEFRAYAGVLAVLSALAALLVFADPALLGGPDVKRVAGDLGASLRHGVFQVVSIITTTGYASLDLNDWNESARFVLLLGMFVGGSAGSTGGAVKVVRWVVIYKTLRRELFRTVHPDAIRPVRLGGQPVDERGIEGIFAFVLIYFVGFFCYRIGTDRYADRWCLAVGSRSDERGRGDARQRRAGFRRRRADGQLPVAPSWVEAVHDRVDVVRPAGDHPRTRSVHRVVLALLTTESPEAVIDRVDSTRDRPGGPGDETLKPPRPGTESMELRVTERLDNELSIELAGEDHTFMNVLKESLLETEGVTAATYDMNPEQSGGQTEPILTIKTEAGVDTLDALEDAAGGITERTTALREAFETAAAA
jgi:DNA-directed RNA polymerase subunit L